MWKSFKESFESPDSYVSLALGFAVVLVVGMITFNYFKAKTTQTAQEAKKQAEEAQKAESLPLKYTVAEGDTLWSISEQFYKSGYNWADIQKANNLANAEVIEKGQSLIIPAPRPTDQPKGEVSSASTELKPEKRQYTIVAGDTLWSIAEKEYKDAYKWTQIAAANKLSNPDLIYAGNVLTLQ